MSISQYKKRILWIALVAGFSSLVFVGKASAQVAVSNLPAGVNGGDCVVAESTSPASSAVNESVFAIVQPNGTMTAVTGNYGMTINCNGGDPTCDALTAAADAATAQGNSLGDSFPQYTDTPSNNNFQLYEGTDTSICGTRSDGSVVGECEWTTSRTVNGVTKTTGNIYFNEGAPESQETITDPAQLMCFTEHEMTHGFGYDDTYTHIDNDPGVMGQGCVDNPPASWATDPTLVAAIEESNTGKTDLLYPNSCVPLTCPSGEIATDVTANAASYTCVPVLACTAAQLAAGGTPLGTTCLMPPAPTPENCTLDPTLQGCTPYQCDSRYTYNSTTMTCEKSSSCVIASSQCVGDNLVATCEDGSTESNYNPSCAQQTTNSSGPSACNPDDPVASPDCPSASTQSCTPNTDGVMQCSYSGGVACSCGTDGQVSCSDANGNAISTPAGACQGACPSGEVQQSDGSCIVNCGLYPDDPSCAGGSADTETDYCSANPDDPYCIAAASCVSDPNNQTCEDYCSVNPDDPACSSSDSDVCDTDPTDPSCLTSADCDDPGNSLCSDYCSANPDDPVCYCVLNPDDSSCDTSAASVNGSSLAVGGNALPQTIANQTAIISLSLKHLLGEIGNFLKSL